MPFIKHDPPTPPPCQSREHNPPNMIVLPPGRHVWQCPACGETQVVYKRQVTCEIEREVLFPSAKRWRDSENIFARPTLERLRG